jgi:hypothetical protein
MIVVSSSPVVAALRSGYIASVSSSDQDVGTAFMPEFDEHGRTVHSVGFLCDIDQGIFGKPSLAVSS